MASFLRPNVAGDRPGDASLSRIADACAAATAAIGLLVMAGWLLHIEPLKSVLPGLVAMKFNSALAFVLGGAALWWRRRPAVRLGLGALVAMFGALVLGEYLSGGDWGIDQLFLREVPAAPAAAFPPGRMAAATSLCFLLCGLALMCSRGPKRGPQPGPTPAVKDGPGLGFVVDVLAFGAAAIAGFVLIGYATGTETLLRLPGFISMALNTAAAFVLLAAGLLCAVPGGMMAQAVRSRDTGRTLWLGFGLLTLLLAMLGVTAVARLQSIGEEVQAQARFSRPRSSATLELEFSLLDYAMGVRRVLAGDTQALPYVTENTADVERWLAEYEVLAQTDRQRELATRFAVQWRELLALGRELLANEGQVSEARLDLFATLRRGLESIVDREMQPEALEAHGSGQAALLLDLQNTEVLILAMLVVGVLIAMAVSRMVSRAVLGHAQALRESEQKFSTVFHAAPIAQSLTVLSDGTLVDVNEAWLQLSGFARKDEAIGKTPGELGLITDAEASERILDELRRSGSVHGAAIAARSRDGVPLALLMDMRPIEIGGRTFILTTSVDITGRKKTDEALRESRALLQAVIDGLPDAVFLKDARSRIIVANPATLRILGKSLDEVIGRDDSEHYADPDVGRAIMENDRRIMESGAMEVVEEVGLTPEGYRTFLSTKTPWRDAEGRVIGLLGITRDITERKRAEEALKESEARYRLVFQTANEGIWVTDGAWKTVLVNQRMADMLGYSVDELQGRVPSEFLQADQEPTVLTARGDLAAGATINREFKFRRKDGSDLWVISSAAPVKDPEGRLIRTVSMLTDITERKAAEDAIRASEAKLRGVLDATQESIWVFDPDGVILLANAVGLARMGRGAQDIIGKRMMEILPRDLGRSRMERLREVVGSARPVEFEDERAGLHFHHSFYPALDSEGRVMFVVSFSQDVTERKKTEALRLALAEQDRVRLGAAVEQASDSVVMFDLDGTIRYVNAAFEAVNRLPRAKAVGHSYFDLLAGDPSAAALRQAIGQGLAWHGSLVRALPEGRTIELEVMYSPAKDPAGVTVGGLVTEADVTQRNALQQQIRQAQKMEALGTLAGGITHDFNNILGTIVINTELALLDLDPSDPARSPLPVVLQAANRGKELVKQIITFSRQRAWERKPVEIAPVVREGLGLLRSTLPKDIVLRETIDDGSGIVLADPSHIHQILVNLCQNAALAMRDRGERQLDVGLEPVEADAAMAVRHPDLKPGPYVRLTVADTGCGMTPEIMERIFEPFYTTRERGSGSGLGLSVVHGIVKSYGGAITVRSRPGQGSVFDIYLPRLGEDVPAVGAEPAPQPVRGRARILVVEDEEAQRTSLARGLERLGYGVTAEPDGRSALAAFRKDPGAFDLVITDQIMPRMSGLELAAELMEVRPDLPVILCTGFSEKVNSGTVGTSGIRELAMKPFTITEISQLIRKVLGKESGAG